MLIQSKSGTACYIAAVVGALSLLLIPHSSLAVTLPWSTTYDCSDWIQSVGLDQTIVNCDGISGGGAWTTSSGKMDQITSSANNPDGDGGKGQRHWKGDGQNNNSGGMRISLPSPQKELWIRWYMRYQQGFRWSPLVYDKWIRVMDGTGSTTEAIVEWYGSDTSNIFVSQNHRSNSGHGWNSVMGGSVSDGRWHLYEVHLKVDTNKQDGIAELWIDQVKRLSYTNINFNTGPGWGAILIGSNQNAPANGTDYYVDFDDIMISNTGYIGPLNGKPAAPINLRVN